MKKKSPADSFRNKKQHKFNNVKTDHRSERVKEPVKKKAIPTLVLSQKNAEDVSFRT